MVKKLLFLSLLLGFSWIAQAEKILCFGDSITQGTYIEGKWTPGKSWVNVANDKADDVEFINAGRSGRRTADIKELTPYLKDLASYDRVIFFLGVNDLSKPKQYSPVSCLKNIAEMVKRCRAQNPNIAIAVCSSTGLNLKTMSKHFYKRGYNEKESELLGKLAQLYKVYCQENGFVYIDLKGVVAPQNFSDGLHPNINGQQQIGDYIYRRLLPGHAVIKVACIGDSITYGARIQDRSKVYPAQLQKLLGPAFEVRNFGLSSRTALKKGDRPYWNEKAYREALNWSPDRVVIKLGTNDIKPKNWRWKESFEADLEALVTSFKNLPNRPRVYLSFPVPVVQTRWGIEEKTLVEELLPRIEKVAQKLAVSVIDFHKGLPAENRYFSDGVHPNAAGAKIMADIAYQSFKADENSALLPVSKLEHDFYNWENRQAEVKKLAQKEKPELIFIGDSITHMFGGFPKAEVVRGGPIWQKYYAPRQPVNMGFGWDRTQNVLWRIEDGALDGISPKVVVLMIGTNNLTGTRQAKTNSAEEIAEGIGSVCRLIHAKLPQSQIVMLGVLPRWPEQFIEPIRQINQLIAPLAQKSYIHRLNLYEKIADKNGLPHREFMHDRVHPNERGYAEIAKALEPLLKNLLGEEK